MANKSDIATKNFAYLVESASEAQVALLLARLASCDSLLSVAKILGINETILDTDNETSQAILALTVAFRQMGALIISGTTLDLEISQIEDLGANVREPLHIMVHRDSARVLTDFYEQANAKAVGRFFSQQGRIESIQSDTQTISLHYYSDASMIARISSLSKSNIDLRIAILDHARTIQDAMTGQELAELLKVLTRGADQMIKESGMPQQAINMLPVLINEQALTLVRALAQASIHSVCIPVSDNDDLMTIINRHAEEGLLTWKSGVSVEVSQYVCSTPADFQSFISMHVGLKSDEDLVIPLSLEDALERLHVAQSKAKKNKSKRTKRSE